MRAARRAPGASQSGTLNSLSVICVCVCVCVLMQNKFAALVLYDEVQSAVIHFAVHQLHIAELVCKLVSKSGLLRVDVGMLHLRVDDRKGVAFRSVDMLHRERVLRQQQPESTRALWHLTGLGWIVRFFLNEVGCIAHTLRSNAVCTL